MKKTAKKIFKGLINKMGFEVRRICSQPYANDSFFINLFKEIKPKTVIDIPRLYVLYQFARQATGLEGEAAECGVYKGGSARLLAKTFNQLSPDKKILLFDSFQGMPPTDPQKDVHQLGDFKDTSFEEVKNFLRDCPNAMLYQGLFKENFPQVARKQFSFVHIDCDIYESVKECCQFFYPRMTAGGILIFDDYGFRSCPGAKMAIDEFFAQKPEKVIVLPTKQALVIKK